MRKFQFTGDWEAMIELAKLTQLDYDGWGDKTASPLVKVTIQDERNFDPYPALEQVSSIVSNCGTSYSQ